MKIERAVLLLPMTERSIGSESAQTLSSAYECSIGSERKTKGIYYTPKYIVDYIVGKTLESRIGVVPSLTVLDPACGCGAFLLGAYQYLLDWHLKSCNGQNGQSRLSSHQRQRILLNSIFGVDSDPKAIEITKRVLLLKLLEGQSNDPVVGSTALPDLSRNIQCGDSLVSPDFFGSGSAEAMPSEDRLLVNAFDWRRAFPDVFREGGFDVVLGNPPYLNGIEARTRTGERLNEYFRSKYASARGAIDASILFQELSLNLLRPGGMTSMIVPNKFLSAPFGAAFRNLVAKSAEIRLLADFSKVDVFEGVGAYPIVYVFEKLLLPRAEYPIDIETHAASSQAVAPVKQAAVMANPASLATWSQIFSSGRDLLARLARECRQLGDLYEVAASATAAEAYAIKQSLSDQKPNEAYFQFVTSGAIDRYAHSHGRQPMRYLKSTYLHPHLPANCQHLNKNRLRQYASEKLIFAGMTKRLEAIWDSGKLAGSVPTVQVLRTAVSPYGLKFVLGIMNSSLINWVFNQSFSSLALSGGYLRIGAPQIRTLPLPKLDLADAGDRNRHDKLVEMADAMLDLQGQRQNPSAVCKQESINAQIDELDYKIGEFIFRLFGISDNDKKQISVNRKDGIHRRDAEHAEEGSKC